MNSNLLRASGKEGKKTLLTRSWKRSLMLALVTLMCVTSAFAGPGVQVGNQQMFRPAGMVRATVPNPLGGAPLTDWWVSDGASGFCRLDNTGPDTRPSNGILNLSTCYLPGVFAPSDYQVETAGVINNQGLPSNGYVFVAGIKEVSRIEFMASPTEPGRTIINAASQVRIFDSTASVFTNGAPVNAGRFVRDSRLGPDGKLYICFQGSGDIWRIRNPLTPNFTPAGNAVERVGTSYNGKTLLSMAWVGHDLWMQQAGFLNRLQNADLCNYTLPKCQAMLEFGKLQSQQGMGSDQFFSKNPNGRWIYWGNGNRIVRYDTTSAGNHEVWNQSGRVCAGPGVTNAVTACPVSPIPQEYTLIFGINFLQTATPTALSQLNPDGTTAFIEDMAVTTDPIIEAPPPAIANILPKTGRTWLYQASPSLVPEPCVTTPLNPPPCVNSETGNDSPPVGAPSNDAARRAVLLLSGVTHARGLLWLQTNWWVSDEDHGFCRIDQNPITGAAAMTHCFQPAGFIPGQPAADKPDALGRQNVYVPDASGDSKGIARLKFIPDGTGGTVSQTGLLNSGRGTAAAVAIPTGPFNDGGVYIGYCNIGSINKIQQPATAPTAPIPVGGLGHGVGALSLAFMGNDLYIAELAPPPSLGGQLVKGSQVTVLQSASPDLQRGGAREVAKPISRLQSPDPQSLLSPQLFTNPAAFAVGPVGDRERCLPPLGVKLSASVPADPGLAPGLYMGSLGLPPASAVSGGLALPPEVAQYGSICTTMIDWVSQGSISPLLSLNLDFAPITALAFNSQTDSKANLAIADDPGLIVPDQTLQKSQLVPPSTGLHGQGHVFIVP
ncbi:MAG TPA: hypothetical protein VNB54_05745 [Alphaproteobacteria bacterium]|nr:hypothetical protein [Alphaproteobacteria bacterium]